MEIGSLEGRKEVEHVNCKSFHADGYGRHTKTSACRTEACLLAICHNMIFIIFFLIVMVPLVLTCLMTREQLFFVENLASQQECS